MSNQRLTDLLAHYEYGGLEKPEQHELVELLIENLKSKDTELVNKVKELNVRAKTVEFYGEQLLEIKAENALLKQELKIKKVN